MMRSHLHSCNIYVQRRCLLASLHRVDSDGIAARRLFTISRRRYNVPSPNYLWLIDGTHKLIKWKLVVQLVLMAAVGSLCIAVVLQIIDQQQFYICSKKVLRPIVCP